MIALFPGRFQPLHKGHEKTVRYLLKKYDKVIIAIGSVNQPRSYRNPFSFLERKKMIEIVFTEEIKKGKVRIIGVKDYYNDEKWANSIIRKINFDVVVTGNPWVARCFKGKKVVEKVKFYKRNVYQSKKSEGLCQKEVWNGRNL